MSTKTTTKKTIIKKPPAKKKPIRKRTTKDKALIIQNTDPGSLLHLAIEKGMDMEKLAKLLDIYQRWEAGKAKKKYFEALAQFQSKCPTIEKKKEVRYNNKLRYRYAPLEDIINQVKDLLKECGFSYSFTQNQENVGVIKITCHLHHINGHTESATLEAHADGSGNKNAIQSIASTVTYLRRYTFCGITGITTADTDDGGQLYEPILKNKQNIQDAEIVQDSLKLQVGKKGISLLNEVIEFVNKEPDMQKKKDMMNEIIVVKENDEKLQELFKKYKEEK
jgi:hypothetical protein